MLGIIANGFERRIVNGDTRRLTDYALRTKIVAYAPPELTADLTEIIRPIKTTDRPDGYGGVYHWDDYFSDQPITCMRRAPDIFSVLPMACVPNPVAKAELDAKWKDIAEVIDIQTPDGETIAVGVDENGEVVTASKRPNWLPLVLAAGAAWVFLM